MEEPNETVGIFTATEETTAAMIARRRPVVVLTLESSGKSRIYLQEDVELRDDATPADLIELRRRLMMTINRFNKKEQAE